MCKLNRREFLATSAAFVSVAAEAELLGSKVLPVGAESADQLAPDVYFHEGSVADNAAAVCNNGWIIFDDYVLVIDANFPSGAKLVISKIRALTDKPIRFAFDTHHHGDHAYGNQVFVENGGVPVAHTGVIEEMRRHETGYYGDKPGNWEEEAKSRPDLKDTKLKPPSVLFPKELYFDDGKHRVELIHLGIAHTHGDAVAWLPKEKILFTGDVCVNGPYNFVGDGDIGKWIATLEAAKKLGATKVCTGHGPRSVASVLDDQQAFFKVLQDQVHSRMVNASPEETKTRIEEIRRTMKDNAQIARYVGDGGKEDNFASQVQKVYEEMTGNKLTAFVDAGRWARRTHAHSHGIV
jgi:glyoxylase-like metal-dependent hydrolase (beta-lactamase superfamily II)